MDKYRVLVIDDDEDIRRVISLVLRPRYEVVEAVDGLDALSRLETIEPDLAIIDLMMPMMDGFQVCEAIRRHPRFQGMPVLFLSAQGSRENIMKGYAVGANLFLTKPIDPERVLKNIDLTIERDPPPLRPKRHTIEQLESQRSNPGERQTDAWSATERPEKSADAPAPHTPPAAGQARVRLLLVDDDTELLQMLDLALRDDYEVTTASNGMEAIERMVDYQPDLMLIDIMMPKMNGYQLVQSIRRNAAFHTLPVVVLSAKCSPKDQEYALRIGANRFLGKPFAITDLLALLRYMAAAPDFRIRAKRLSFDEIRARLAAEHSLKLGPYAG